MGPDLTAGVAPVVVDDRFLAGIEEQGALASGGWDRGGDAANLKRKTAASLRVVPLPRQLELRATDQRLFAISCSTLH
jgi:hypothetical protein